MRRALSALMLVLAAVLAFGQDAPDVGSHMPSQAAADVLRYRSRLSGPLADRIDLHVQVPPVSIERLASCAQGERSPDIRDRVEAARARQRARYPDDSCNARAPGRWLDAHGGVDPSARALLGGAAERLHLSARAFHRVLRVARTIADLETREEIGVPHVAEAPFALSRSSPAPLPSPREP